MVAISCSKDDGLGSLVISVDEVTDHTAKISWSISGAESAVFEITLNGNVISNGSSSTQYTFTDLNQLQEYNGVVFARTPNNGETFTTFSFRTLEDRYKEGDMYIAGQAQMDNFNFTTIEGGLTITGEDITDISNLSSLEEVGGIHILRTNLTNLYGLHNVVRFTEGEGTILFSQNSILSDVSALSNLSGFINFLRARYNPSLIDLSPLGIAEGGTLWIEVSPITNLEQVSYGGHIDYLKLKDLPNLNSLNGLQELPRLGRLNIDNVPNLQNLNALDGLSELRKIEFRDLDQFSDFSGLINVSVSERIQLIDLPALSSLNGLQATTSLNELHLWKLPALTNLQGLNNLTEVGIDLLQFEPLPLRAFTLINIAITNLQGLDNLRAVRDINIRGCDFIESLDGAPFETNGSLDYGRWINITGNPILTDFCGLTQYANNVELDIYIVSQNAYNPTIVQIQSTTQCSQ